MKTADKNTLGKTSRRNFLASTAAHTATLLAGSSFSRFAHAAGTERFNVALIGAGGRGTGAAADCLRGAKHIKVVAIADAFEDRAQLSRKTLQQYFGDQVDVPDERLFVGLDAYKKAIACDVDLIVHGTTPGFRPLHYRAAIEAGKHVFMEKPCCVDAGGFRSVMETNKLADKKNLKVGVGLFRRHMPNYLEAMKKLYDGELGRVQFQRCYCLMPGYGGAGARKEMSELEYQIRNWHVFDWLGGGRLVEAHCHELDVMNWAVGNHPVEANGLGGRQLPDSQKYGTDFDHNFLEYSYANGSKTYSQSRFQKGVERRNSEHIHTDKTVVDLAGKIKISRARRRRKSAEERTDVSNPYRLEFTDLLDAIWNDKPYNEGWYGATSSFTAVLGREASYSGETIQWDELAEKGASHTALLEDLNWNSEPPLKPNEEGNYEHLLPVPGIYKPF